MAKRFLRIAIRLYHYSEKGDGRKSKFFKLIWLQKTK